MLCVIIKHITQFPGDIETLLFFYNFTGDLVLVK